MEQVLQWFVDSSLTKVTLCSLDMIYMINSFECQENDFSFSLNTNEKPKSTKLEKTILLIQIFSDRLSQWLLFVWK